jgi:hypothetical protein
LLQDNVDFVAAPERMSPVFYGGVSADPRGAAEFATDLKVAADGSIVLCGYFLGNVDFNPGPGTKFMHTFDLFYPDAFVLKLNSSGNFVWVDQFGARFTDAASALAIDNAGNIMVSGFYSRTVTFAKGGPTLTALGRQDAFAMKLSSGGKVRWVDSFGAEAIFFPQRDGGDGIAVDPQGNVYVVGTFVGNADFNPSLTASTVFVGRGQTDGYLVKLNNSGQFIRAFSLGAEGFDGLNRVAIGPGGEVVVAGYFQGAAFDADPGVGATLLSATPLNPQTTLAVTDVFVEKLDSNFSLQWVRQLAGSGYELTDQLKIDTNGQIVLSGSYYGIGTRFGDLSTLFTSVAGPGDGFGDFNDTGRLNSYDPFLWELDTTGHTAWVATWGGPSDEFGAGFDFEADHSIIFTGRFRGTVDFNPGPGTKKLRSSGLADAFVTQFDQNGQALF